MSLFSRRTNSEEPDFQAPGRAGRRRGRHAGDSSGTLGDGQVFNPAWILWAPSPRDEGASQGYPTEEYPYLTAGPDEAA